MNKETREELICVWAPAIAFTLMIVTAVSLVISDLSACIQHG